MSSAMLTALQGTLLRPAFFVQMTFVTGTVYLWTGLGTISWNGHSWSGVGSLGGISTAEEGSTVEARGITLSLSGIDASLLADVLQEFQIGSPVAVFLGLFDGSSPPNLIADPLCTWRGRMDQPTIDVSSELATIFVNCESRLLEYNVATDRRYTQDDQQISAPGDLSMSFVSGIQELNLYWGKSPATSTNL